MDNTADLIKGMQDLATFVDTRLSEFEKSQQQVPASTNPTVKTVNADYIAFKSLVWKTLGMLKAQLQLIVDGQDRLETHSRRKVLLIHGIPEATDEDLPQKVLKIAQERMKLTTLDSSSFEVCHRLGSKRDKDRPVLVRFSSMLHRSAVWRAKTSLRGSKVSISEFLTKSRQEVFSTARKHFGMKQCWTSDGAIVILLPDKSRKKVHVMAELQPLMKQYPKKDSSA
ncbi:hypothetical protein NE865_07881 [Phthorimaea operculella]|nr:hypothetical protein NE865_07881 [Phthorimaea operculella]